MRSSGLLIVQPKCRPINVDDCGCRRHCVLSVYCCPKPPISVGNGFWYRLETSITPHCAAVGCAPRCRECYMKSRILGTCMLFLLIYPATSLRAVSLPEMAREQLTVRELMQLANEQAMQAQRRRKTPAAAAVMTEPGPGV